MKLKNKIIIITGGSGLLGTEIINCLNKNSATVINFEINIKTSEDLKVINCDITNQNSVKTAIKKVITRFGRIDGLINNAYPRTPDWGTIFEEIKYDSWKENIDFQLNSYFYISQQVGIYMIKQQSGSIINMASIYGSVGPDFTLYDNTKMTMPAAYSAIKGGIINFTRYLASYLGKYNINVNTISPGGIYDNQNPVFVENYNKKVPMKRMGTPKDIAPSVAFLLSDEAKYITGQDLIIDGGWTAI